MSGGTAWQGALSGASEPAPLAIGAATIAVGDTFADSKQFHIMFERVLVGHGRQSRLDKRVSGGKGKLHRCTGAIYNGKEKTTLGCQVRARACKQKTKEWKVTEVELNHVNCTGQSSEKKQRICRRSVQAEAAALINSNGSMSAPALARSLKSTQRIDIKERTANRMIREERGKEDAAIKGQYEVLQSYLSILGQDNGNIVDCEWDANGRFKSCFVMLGAAARMATAGVQQAFAMDCAVFKGEWEGQFGTLSFKDANNHIIHVATRVQAKENAAMYVGLLTKTMEHPGLRDLLNNPNMTCFTDKHKGSDSAVPKICPLTEDRRCVEHLIKNMGAIGTSGRYLVYQAAKAATSSAFEHYMQRVKSLNENAYTKLNAIPHSTWANYACRPNAIWDQTTSNMAESVNNMIGAKTREKPVLGFIHDIVLQTARRIDVAANLKKSDPTAVVTPFATSTWEAEFKLADTLAVNRNGGSGFMVYPQENSFLSNRVNLVWGEGPGDHHYDCTCKWCPRFKMPCRHVLAVAIETETANRALELIDNGYSLAKFRAAADDPSFRVVPPIWPDLTINPDHYPPPDVDGKPGRPKNGPRKKTRIMSNGETNTSSRTYAIYNASVRAAGGVGILPSGGGGAGGGGSDGGASGALDLSQGASQGAP